MARAVKEADRHGKPAIMGDTVRGGSASFVATVLNVPPGGEDFTLEVVKDGVAIATVPVTPPGITHEFSGGPGRYRLELRRDAAVYALTTPIWVVD